ncbi:High-affnity carbon uptake protein Hat/HatR [Mycoavidus cysteinexigens]|uniref:High-affnity carbon uptake protein Hat/HatR n=1 Tax=Mycoavidus cysteinexigens TaxID=1553431 RepID=A0A2Z6EVB1_9BURK|nr:pentapeptide repeat-containing protein [Mycoavidus cysteinexigens]BBE09403.1 High-affnity carbon uptake protein Hat/HatR [Mycoavidus cysteinexigens]GLR02221.1 hypothetical protein GCM10007934_20360 [Mycoavidus cysteinexigens]
MFSQISSSGSSYIAPVRQQKEPTSLLPLPKDIMEKIEDLMDPDTRLSYGEALLDLTENKKVLSSPAWRLSLLSCLLERVSSKRHAIFLAQIPEVKKFVFDQFRALWEQKSTEFHRIVEIPVLFNLLHSIQDQEVLNFLAEKVQQTTDLRWRLLMWIERSKTEEVQTQAANAMTLLVKAGVSLSGKNFQGIRVPGADLSYGVFDSTLFQGADLSRVNLRGAWLREANFAGANLDQACFGETLLASAKDRALQQVKSTSLQQALTEQTDNFIARSQDEKWFVSGKDDAINLWSVNATPSPQLHRTFKRSGYLRGNYLPIAFSPDSRWLTLSHTDSAIELWSLKTDAPILCQTLQGWPSYLGVFYLAFSSDGNRLIASNQSEIKLWLFEDELFKLQYAVSEKGSLNSVSFSPDGQWLALNKKDHPEIEVWALKIDQPILQHQLKGHTDSIKALSFSPNGDWLLSSDRHIVKLWLVKNTSFVPWQTWHVDSFTSYSVMPTLRSQWVTAFSNGFNQYISYAGKGSEPWAVEIDARLCWRVPAGHANTGSIQNIVFSRDGRRLASSHHDRTINLWSLEMGVPTFEKTLKMKVLNQLEKSGTFSNLAFSRDSRWLGAVDGHAINLWNLSALEGEFSYYPLRGHAKAVEDLAFSPDGRWLVSASADKTVRLWSLQTYPPEFVRELTKMPHHYGTVYSVAFSEDGKWLAAGAGDFVLKLWPLPFNKKSLSAPHTFQVGGFSQERDPVSFWNLAFSPDSQQLAIGCDDNWVRHWSLSDNPPAEIYDFSMRQADGIKNVAFSPDGEWLATSDWNKSVCVWSAASGKRLAKIDGFVGPATLTARWWKNDQDSAFQDNVFLITGGPDQAIRFWRVIKTDNQGCQVSLHWTSHQTRLTATRAYIEGARNLSSTAQKLLIGYGAQDPSASISDEEHSVSEGEYPVLEGAYPVSEGEYPVSEGDLW